jgi:hypothetical protein
MNCAIPRAPAELIASDRNLLSCQRRRAKKPTGIPLSSAASFIASQTRLSEAGAPSFTMETLVTRWSSDEISFTAEFNSRDGNLLCVVRSSSCESETSLDSCPWASADPTKGFAHGLIGTFRRKIYRENRGSNQDAEQISHQLPPIGDCFRIGARCGDFWDELRQRSGSDRKSFSGRFPSQPGFLLGTYPVFFQTRPEARQPPFLTPREQSVNCSIC